MMAVQSYACDWTLQTLLGGIVEVAGIDDLPIDGVCIDSRKVSPGDLFVSCATNLARAHEHVSEAVCKGAVAVVAAAFVGEHGVPVLEGNPIAGVAGQVADRYFGHPSRHMRVIGVTGTNGKTSVSHYIAHALTHSTSHAPCGLLGTLGYGHFGALQPGFLTTPDVLTIHRELAALRAAGATDVVMEVSSHALDQQRVSAVDFDFAVFTNLTRDHLDYHPDMDAYGATKQKLFTEADLHAAIINSDDEFGRYLIADSIKRNPVFAYGLSESNSLIESNNSITPVCGRVLAAHRYSLALGVSTPSAQADFSAPVLGRFNAYNILAAIGTLQACGVSLEEAAQCLTNLPAVPGRMESFGGRTGQPLVVVDYSHTPDSLRSALEALREQSKGRLWCVFGCGGDRDRGKRPQMAAAAANWADELVITDDNPRTENGDVIVEQMLAGLPTMGHNALVLRDRRQAIRYAIEHAMEHDTVLVAGKGHESYQDVDGERRSFSDATVVRVALKELRW